MPDTKLCDWCNNTATVAIIYPLSVSRTEHTDHACDEHDWTLTTNAPYTTRTRI